MTDGTTLVFVEVRARESEYYGTAAETIGHSKQRRLILAAQRYLADQSRQWSCRFDVVTLTGAEGNESIDWIKNAFDAF